MTPCSNEMRRHPDVDGHILAVYNTVLGHLKLYYLKPPKSFFPGRQVRPTVVRFDDQIDPRILCRAIKIHKGWSEDEFQAHLETFHFRLLDDYERNLGINMFDFKENPPERFLRILEKEMLPGCRDPLIGAVTWTIDWL